MNIIVTISSQFHSHYSQNKDGSPASSSVLEIQLKILPLLLVYYHNNLLKCSARDKTLATVQ